MGRHHRHNHGIGLGAGLLGLGLGLTAAAVLTPSRPTVVTTTSPSFNFWYGSSRPRWISNSFNVVSKLEMLLFTF